MIILSWNCFVKYCYNIVIAIFKTATKYCNFFLILCSPTQGAKSSRALGLPPQKHDRLSVCIRRSSFHVHLVSNQFHLIIMCKLIEALQHVMAARLSSFTICGGKDGQTHGPFKFSHAVCVISDVKWMDKYRPPTVNQALTPLAGKTPVIAVIMMNQV